MAVNYGPGKPSSETWFAMTRPDFHALSFETGEVTDSLSVLQEGAHIIFPDMANALADKPLRGDEIEGDPELNKYAIDLVRLSGKVTFYGSVMASGRVKMGRRGVRLSGLQGYSLPISDLADMRNFWSVLDEICKGAGAVIQSSPGKTSKEIAQALSPEWFTTVGKHKLDWAHQSYSGGARHDLPGEYPQAFLYDIHSAYPSIMKGDLPFGRARHTRNGRSLRDSDFYIATVILDYDSDLRFSPLWVRDENRKGRIYHPVIARNVKCVLTSDDLATLEKHGRLRIKKEIDRISFQQRPLLAPAQEYLAECQAKYPQYRRQIKVLRNSMYGIFVQTDERLEYTLEDIKGMSRDEARSRGILKWYGGDEFGLFRTKVPSQGFSDSPVASAVTARLRAKLYDAIDTNTIAARTDSILSTVERPDLALGSGEGQWDFVDKGPAIVWGRRGYKVNGHFHVDGGQKFDDTTEGYKALTYFRDKKAFGSPDYDNPRTWRLLIEKPEMIKIYGSRIEIYHSPLADVKEAKVPFSFLKQKDP